MTYHSKSPYGLMAMTLACRAGDPGSIPGVGVFLLPKGLNILSHSYN